MADQSPIGRAPRYDDMPARMRKLPLDPRGYPVPWFVAWESGVPIFTAMDARKLTLAWRQELCWVCGGKLGRIRTFVIGPMCAVNRISSAPPSHLECARFAARRCPFLARPKMRRQGDTYYDGKGVKKGTMAGIGLERNPGVALVWQTLRPGIFRVTNGYLFDVGKPHAVEWFCEGRPATRAEVMASIDAGLPALLELVAADPNPAGARLEFDARVEAAMILLPAR